MAVQARKIPIGGACMADYSICVFLDDAKLTRLEEVGLGAQFQEIGGKKAVQVPLSQKEQKKLLKSFPDLTFDASNACVLPEAAENTLLDIVVSLKTLDVMKVAILKLFNPLAGKGLRTKTF
jgi:hypothetical protein